MKTAGSVNVEIGATFAGTFKSAFGAADDQMSRLGGTVRALDGRLQNVAGFRKLTEDTKQAGYAWQAAKVKAEQFAQALAATENPTKKQAAELRRAQAAADRAGEAFARSRERLANMRKALTDAGISTKNLADDQKKLERQLEVTQNRMTALAGVANSGVGKAFGEVGSKFRSLATQAAVAGAGLGYFFKKNFVDVASEFEKFKTILETTEGSAAGADKAMKWVSDFAAKTPFELAEVTQAFVKLRAYGLDPTNGLLRTLGDTGAAMGKPVMQAVEAIADAITGENERLKEFGIKGSKKGGQITYEFTDKAGRQRTKTVDAENRKMIESTLTAIWNEKYGGAMDKLSGTWAGMVSNVKDQWARFANNTMNAGLFEWMKGRLSDLLGTLDRMAANGELQTWAERTGKSLVAFAENAWALGKSIVDTTAKIAAFVGGWENLGMIIVALKFAPLIVSIGQLGAALFSAAGFLMMFATGTATAGAAWLAFGKGLVTTLAMIGTAFKTLAVFLLTNPIGIALTLLSFAGFVLWQNWETVKGGLVAVWQTIKETAISAFDAIKSAVGAVIDWLAEKTAWIFQTVDKVKAAASSIGDGIGSAWQGAKNLVGAGQKPGAAMTGAPAAAAVVPAARSGPTINQTNHPQYNITVQGSASDPAATAKAVRAEMDRREREKAANRRGMLTDALGY
jgi:phage tail tape-measure protein